MPAVTAEPDIDSYVRNFEAARGAGRPARVGDHLPPPGHPARAAAAAELVRVDLEYGWAAGRPRPVADYLAELPELAARSELVAGVAFEEYRQKLDHGQPADPADYRARYGVDTSGWPPPSGPPSATQPVSGVPAAGHPADDLAAAARAYRAAGCGSAASGGDRRASSPSRWAHAHRLPASAAAELFRHLHASDPSAAARLAKAVAAFPEVGSDFLGFRLTAELGRGAFGRVFLARQGDLADRPVALKVSAELSAESHTLARLQHTNIVPIYSAHRAGPLQAVCMPYLGATTLADVVGEVRRHGSVFGSGRELVSTLNMKQSRTRRDAASADRLGAAAAGHPLPAAPVLARLTELPYVGAVLWIAARLADGLQHAHDRGVVHRDIKPANVLLTDDGQPMLLDFNLASGRQVGGPAAARVGGTLPYMAPEHLAAFLGRPTGPIDARSDLYSLGLVVYELLAGRPAFPVPAKGGSAKKLIPDMLAARRAGPPGLRAVNPAVSPAAEAVVLKLLAADPAARYQTAGQLREDIDRHLADRPLAHTREPSRRERVRKWARRNPRLASAGAVATAAAVLVAAVVGSTVGVYRQLRQHQAVAEVAAFRADKAEAEAALGSLATDPHPDGLAAAVDTGRKALGRFGADAPGWDGHPAVGRLPADLADDLRRQVGELLFLVARGTALQADHHTAGAGRPDRRAEAARLSALAVGCFDPVKVPAAVRVQADELAARAAGRPPAPRPVNPTTPRDAYLRAADLLTADRPADALPLADRAVQGDPDLFPARFVLGLCLAKAGLDERAEAAFDSCVALQPGNPWGWLNRGRMRMRVRNMGGAAADFGQVIDLRPADPRPYFDRAAARAALRDHRGAAADLTAALDRGGSAARVRFARSKVYRDMGDAARADADLAAGLTLQLVSAPEYVARGLARVKVDPAAALADFTTASRFDPAFAPAQLNAALVLGDELNRPADAVGWVDRLLAAAPDHLPARIQRATLLARLGDRAKAVAEAADVLDRDRTPPTVYHMGGVYARLSAAHPADKARALELLGRAFAKGYGLDRTDADPDLAPLRHDPAFAALVADAKAARR